MEVLIPFSNHSFKPASPSISHMIYEQEADAMADKVMRMTNTESAPEPFFKPAVSSVQKKCAHCEEEKSLFKKTT